MTLRKAAFASVLLLSVVSPVWAAGDNVVVVAVSKVSLPSHLPGLCEVSGVISQVWDGKAFHAGSPISLKVPCGSVPRVTPAVAFLNQPDGVHLIAADVLFQSKEGLARIDDTGQVIWQYSTRLYGPWGVAGGYRVLDGAAVPAMPDRAIP